MSNQPTDNPQPDAVAPSPSLRQSIIQQCQSYRAVFIGIEEDSLRVACHKHTTNSVALLQALRFTCGLKISIEFWPKAQIEQMLSQANDALKSEPGFATQSNDQNLDDVSPVPVIQFLNQTLGLAIQRRASDVHFEPFEHYLRVRLRIDGVLQVVSAPDFSIASGVIARLKIVGGLNVAEHRLPQDGQFSVNYGGLRYSMRIASLPVLQGEKLVLRILDNSQQQLSLEALGMTSVERHCYIAALNRPQGLVLVTGPTGSGKTVTLYSGLRYLNAPERNICSVEDPAEIPLTGINQTQVNLRSGLNFSSILRSLLRQDPDVIMVGEIRDAETAEIVVKASQTGHLVLSTLHTNSTTETLMRLAQMGVKGYQIAASLRLVIAQRLVRKLCPHCKISEQTLIKPADDRQPQNLSVWRAKGCQRCFSGYYGRVGIYELLENDLQLQQALAFSADPCVLLRAAKAQNRRTLLQSGLALVEQGITSLDELYRVTGEGSLC